MNEYREALHQAAEFMREADRFLVVSHQQPDGDATGSVLAVAHLLQQLNKSFQIVNEGPTPKRFSFLSGYKQIRNLSFSPIEQRFSSIVAVDIADEERYGEAIHLIHPEARVLNLDHHPTNTRFGQINVVYPEAASTTEILYDVINQQFPELLNKELAECLYTGLLTDTGGFRYANTTRQAMEKAAHLLSYDLQPASIAEQALESTSIAHLQLLKNALQNISFAYEQQIAIMSVTEKDFKQAQANPEDANGLVSYPRKIEGVRAGVLLKQLTPGEVKVSLRSTEDVDVGFLAQKFGGGGHSRAAGFTYYGSVEDAQKQIVEQLTKLLGDA